MNSSKTQASLKNVNSWAKAYFYIRWRAVDETKVKSTLKSEWDKIVNKTDNKLFDVMANFLTELDQLNKKYSIPEMRKYKR